MMEHLLSADAGLAAAMGALLASAFLAATLLPLSSEAVLLGVLALYPDERWPAVGLATLGNTAGGMTTYLIGRYAATKRPLRHLEALRRHGAALTALGWLPVAGEALCLGAGWLKLNWVAVACWQAVGRLLRYALLVQGL